MVEKITLTPLDSNRRPDTSKKLVADFNPESLRMSRHRLGGSGAQRSNASGTAQASAEQTTGMSATLSLELLFDTSRTGKNVQNTTLQIAGMLGPVDTSGTETQVTLVQIQWGAFLFNGSINSMEETLDLFSDQGVPLRSTVSLSLTEVQLEAAEASRGAAGTGAGAGAGAGFGASAGFSAGVSAGVSAGASVGFSAGVSAGAGFSAGAAIGTQPLTLAQSGDSLQSLSARAGVDWKAVAAANNVDNPRLLQAGAVINLNASAQASASASASAGASASASASVG